jgi:hypothetical protein
MKSTVVLLLLVVAGCASAIDCGSDWFAIGQRDGRMNALNQTARYSAQCSGMDSARYNEGYRDGFSQRPIPLW